MRNLADFRQPDGSYEIDGCGYDCAEDLLQCGFLGLCGCGFLEKNLRYVASILSICDGEDWSGRSKMRENPANAFAMYVLNEKRFLEHGCSIPGWTTKEGKELLHLINEALTEEIP